MLCVQHKARSLSISCEAFLTAGAVRFLEAILQGIIKCFFTLHGVLSTAYRQGLFAFNY